MAKFAHNDVLDGTLNILRNASTKVTICTQQPTNFTEANVTYKLAEASVGAADFTLGAGSPDGRRATIAAKSTTVATTGTATHVALVDAANSKLLYVTTCTSQALTSGNALTIQSWTVDVGAPV
jgi:CHASE2 domain-containing sensor protein